ncbi:MAG: 16S rRNA (guanine(966)-N(2))-methyltransferase RsmD [Elusimicrobia bacterium]|nr:16S rRNA (guanine(966)-N(2))-methyltransferase RsmD [Elusimicrobiota bacterium]
MTMRIIAGTARGRRIFTTPKDIMVRPISGRIRQQLFDIIRPLVTGSYFLDLFAGTGAVGLEALSRGAQKAVFIEVDNRCLKVIGRNLVHLGFEDRGTALRGNATNALTWVMHRTNLENFDLIFMGPPYREADNTPLFLARPTLEHISTGKLLSPHGWIMAQHHQKEEPGVIAGLEMFRREKHGDSRVSFYRWAKPAV